MTNDHKMDCLCVHTRISFTNAPIKVYFKAFYKNKDLFVDSNSLSSVESKILLTIIIFFKYDSYFKINEF